LNGLDRAAENKDSEALARHLGYQRRDTIHVSNLAYKMDSRDLKELFGDCGAIKDVRVPRDSRDMNKGFGFVTFESEKSVRKAVNYDGHRVYNRRIKVKIADTRREQIRSPTRRSRSPRERSPRGSRSPRSPRKRDRSPRCRSPKNRDRLPKRSKSPRKRSP
jgi:RNA recognition motif-containing protein